MKKNIGLALSGGGSKGLIHVGALQYFEENKIKFDTLAGTSAGAIVAGLYSCGIKPIDILEFFETTKIFYPSHLSLNYKGIINTTTLHKDFEKIIGNPNIEDLKADLQIVATNMLRGTMKIFSKGNLIDAILSSSAFPGMFTPMKIDDTIYSDGGIVNNFPIDLISNKSDINVGIDFSTFSIQKEEELNNMFDILNRSFNIMRKMNIGDKTSIADIYLNPVQEKQLGIFDTNKEKLEENFEIGYSFTEQYFKDNPNKLELLKN